MKTLTALTVVLCLILTGQGARAQIIDDGCTVTTNGQTVQVNPDGSFRIVNVPSVPGSTSITAGENTGLRMRWSEPIGTPPYQIVMPIIGINDGQPEPIFICDVDNNGLDYNFILTDLRLQAQDVEIVLVDQGNEVGRYSFQQPSAQFSCVQWPDVVEADSRDTDPSLPSWYTNGHVRFRWDNPQIIQVPGQAPTQATNVYWYPKGESYLEALLAMDVELHSASNLQVNVDKLWVEYFAEVRAVGDQVSFWGDMAAGDFIVDGIGSSGLDGIRFELPKPSEGLAMIVSNWLGTGDKLSVWPTSVDGTDLPKVTWEKKPNGRHQIDSGFLSSWFWLLNDGAWSQYFLSDVDEIDGEPSVYGAYAHQNGFRTLYEKELGKFLVTMNDQSTHWADQILVEGQDPAQKSIQYVSTEWTKQLPGPVVIKGFRNSVSGPELPTSVEADGAESEGDTILRNSDLWTLAQAGVDLNPDPFKHGYRMQLEGNPTDRYSWDFDGPVQSDTELKFEGVYDDGNSTDVSELLVQQAAPSEWILQHFTSTPSVKNTVRLWDGSTLVLEDDVANLSSVKIFEMVDGTGTAATPTRIYHWAQHDAPTQVEVDGNNKMSVFADRIEFIAEPSTPVPTQLTSVATKFHNLEYALITEGSAGLVTSSPTLSPALAPMLLPASPNPFNPRTTISFEMRQSGRANVSVYTLSGRLVTVLADEFLGEGSHQRSWAGTDTSGGSVASGVYLVRLDAGGVQESQKVTLVK